MLAHGNSGLAERRTAAGEAPREGRRGAFRRGVAGDLSAYPHPRALGARSGTGCTQEFSFAAQVDCLGPAAILRRARVGARSLCGIASIGGGREKAAGRDVARRPLPIEPARAPGFSDRTAARLGTRGILLSVPGFMWS